MSGDKACGKQTAQYIGKQPDEGGTITSRDTASAEDEVHAPDHKHTSRHATQTQPAFLAPDAFAAALESVPGGLVQNLGGWSGQDDHAEKDLEESQRGSGQDAPA